MSSFESVVEQATMGGLHSFAHYLLPILVSEVIRVREADALMEAHP